MYAGDEMLAIIIHQAKGGKASGALSLTSGTMRSWEMLSAPSQAHFTSRPDVLVGTPGFLCPDNHTDSYTLVNMDLVVAFGVIAKAISGRNGHMVRECQWRWASRPTSCWRWCRRSKKTCSDGGGH